MPPTTMKLSDEEAQLIRQMRDQLMKQGTASIEAMPAVCPKCGVEMVGVRLTAEHWQCQNCGYSQDGLKLGVAGTLALGAVAGAGIVALLWYLHEKAKEG